MSKRFIGAGAVLMLLAAPVFAVGEDDSPEVYCAEEARDAGIVDQEEIRSYVAECVEQIKQELAQERLMQQEGSAVDAERPIEGEAIDHAEMR